MPFSSLNDPADIARAHAALEAVWRDVRETIPRPRHEAERTKIAYIVAGLVPLALDEEDLKQSALSHYRKSEVL